MAVLIEGGIPNGHNCCKELPPTEHTALLSGNVYPTSQLRHGTIARCSCGILWVAERYTDNYSQWQQAGWLTRHKYRHQGWEGVNNEGY